MSISKWYVCYNGQREPDYENTFFHEFIDKSFKRISFRELFSIISKECYVDYKELEGSKQGAYFYIDSKYHLNTIMEKYNYFEFRSI
jgi:hypothetical protein